MGRHLRKVACPLLLSGGTPVAIREATGPDTQHELAPVRRPSPSWSCRHEVEPGPLRPFDRTRRTRNRSE
jgi:hypothetical protein